jgi:hypothetical protein
VVHAVNGGSQWSTLKHTNYTDWVVLMRIQLQVHGLWEALKEGDYDEHDNRAALSALLHVVPPELVHILAAKDNAKVAWGTARRCS